MYGAAIGTEGAAVIDKRVSRVIDNLNRLGLSQMLVSDPASIAYLSGYRTSPGERFFALYVSQGRGCTMFCNRLFPDASAFCGDVVVFSDTDDPVGLVCDVVDAAEPLGVDKTLAARWLLPLMNRAAASSFVLASAAVDDARSIKDADELEAMREASRINDEAMGWLKAQVRPGVTESQIAEGLLGEYRRLGADGFSFDPIVSFGANAVDPHHEPDDTRLVPGDMVLFDVGCVYRGYCSDMTRTFFTAEPTDLERKVYETVRIANEEAEKVVRPGALFSAIDGTARDIIEAEGWGEWFNHRLGHQIGTEVHEPGDVSAIHHEPVQAGQVFSIEPGIYLPEGVGVRIEDLVVVTEGGCEVLNSYPKELTIIEL